MNPKENIRWFIARNITGKTFGMQFYVTVLNTFGFEGPGPSGTDDQRKVTWHLMDETKRILAKKKLFGWMSTLRGLAEGSRLMVLFWFREAERHEALAAREKEQKIILVRMLSEAQIPLALSALYPPEFCEGLAKCGFRTLDDIETFMKAGHAYPHPLLTGLSVPNEEDCQKVGEWINFYQVLGDFGLIAK